ncbi:OsmC family protein [Aneurinibacillus sp. BA2021]|nr:OsmC family protein [Aneurinibacillus sp. BA2021]
MTITKENDATKEIRKVRVRTEWAGKFETVQHVRDFSFTVDEPEKLGGTNKGPTPLEYVLGAYNGCLQVVIETIARELSVHITAISLYSEGTVDRRGMFGTADVSPHFQQIRTTIEMEVAEGKENMEEVKQKLYQRCPMYNLIKDARIEQEIVWKIR